jgi:Flp pilus assembly protein TadG
VPRLTLPLQFGRRRGARGDHGAVAVLVAVLLAGGVLLGMAAYAIDVSLMYAERAQVLNAADAVAMAAAQECVRQTTNCQRQTPTEPQLVAVANGNAGDNAMSIDELCVKAQATGGPDPCTTPSGSATRCLTDPPADVSYAQVLAGTKTADDKTVLPPVFAGAAVRGYTGAHVVACARVAWGPPQGPYAALTVSRDLLSDLVRTSVDGFQPAPPAGITDTPGAVEQVINLQDAQDSAPADDGGLGYLNADPKNPTSCLVDVASNADLPGKTNNQANTMALPTGCDALIKKKEFAASSDPQPYLLMPVYNSENTLPTGEAQFMNIYGIVAFRITGHQLSDTKPDPDVLIRDLPDDKFCGDKTTTADRCIRGYFVWANIIDGTLPAFGWPRTLGVATYKTVG